MTLTFDQALERALGNNEGLKVAKEKVVETQARVQESKTNFLPQVNLGYTYTPSQRFPVIKIPAGVFGPEEQTFQAGFAQANILQLYVNQPIYTGGRLNTAYGITTSTLDASKLELDRTRQEIEYRVVETFYAALMNQRGVAVAEEQIRLNEKQLELAKVRFESGIGGAPRRAAGRGRTGQLEGPAHPGEGAGRHRDAGAAQRAVAAANAAADARRLARRAGGRPCPRRARLAAARSGRTSGPSTPAARRPSTRRTWPRASGSRASILTGNMQYQQDSVGSLLGRDNQSYAFGLQFNVPLFAAPGAAARRSVAQSQMRQAEHGLRFATDNARLELESAWTALEASAEVVTTQEKALELARESVSIAQVSYENGVITSAELNDAQVRLLQTEWLLMQAKYARITAAARAKVAAGVS